MSNLHEAKFVDSMSNLGAGDLICRIRDGVKAFAVVLATNSDKTRLQLTLSEFRPIVTVDPHQKSVSLDSSGWLVDEGGAILLMPEEWDSTEKDGAKAFLASVPKAHATSREEKAREVVRSLADTNKGLRESARDILKIVLDKENPADEEVRLIAFALKCAADHVWEHISK